MSTSHLLRNDLGRDDEALAYLVDNRPGAEVFDTLRLLSRVRQCILISLVSAAEVHRASGQQELRLDAKFPAIPLQTELTPSPVEPLDDDGIEVVELLDCIIAERRAIVHRIAHTRQVRLCALTIAAWVGIWVRRIRTSWRFRRPVRQEHLQQKGARA